MLIQLKKLVLILICHSVVVISVAQNLKYTFFDYKQDSIKSRLTQLSMPSNGQTAGISNNLVADYISNTRISVSTSIIASKNDTFLALHSLFNGVGNFTFEFETPIFCYPINTNYGNFVGMSINPRTSTIVNSSNMFQKSTLNLDVGFNNIINVQGELGNLKAKLILRNSIAWGNNQFIEKIYNVNSNAFYYCSFQIRLKANNNIFIINSPILIKPIDSREITGFPVYAGFGFNF